MSDQPEQGGDSRTPQERKAVEAHMAAYDERKMYMSPAGHFLAGYRSRDAAAQAEIAALRQDAERYRWLRARPKVGWQSQANAYFRWGEGEKLDAAIDAALADSSRSGKA